MTSHLLVNQYSTGSTQAVGDGKISDYRLPGPVDELHGIMRNNIQIQLRSTDNADVLHNKSQEAFEEAATAFKKNKNAVNGKIQGENNRFIALADRKVSGDQLESPVKDLHSFIRHHLEGAKALLDRMKETERKGESQEAEIIRLQPELRDHCRRASGAWADLKILFDAGTWAGTEDEIARLRHEIDILKRERVLVYSRSRLRHSAALLKMTPNSTLPGCSSSLHSSNIDAKLDSRSSHGRSTEKTAFWRHLRLMKKHLKKQSR